MLMLALPGASTVPAEIVVAERLCGTTIALGGTVVADRGHRGASLSSYPTARQRRWRCTVERGEGLDLTGPNALRD